MSLDGRGLVERAARVQVRAGYHTPEGHQPPVVAEGVVVAYSDHPQICVRGDDGVQSWWPTSLPVEELNVATPPPPPPAATVVAVVHPWGHSHSAHVLLGWCGHCKGRTVEQEVIGWRVWAVSNVAEASPG